MSKPSSISTSVPAALPAPAAPPAIAASGEIPLRLLLTRPAYDKYAVAASAAGMDVEDYLREHLTQTAHIDCRTPGLWFPESDAKRLQTLAGLHGSRDTARLATKLEALAECQLEDLIISLDADVLGRIRHNYRVRNGSLTVTEFARREMVNGLRQSVGLMPRR